MENWGPDSQDRVQDNNGKNVVVDQVVIPSKL